MNHIPEEQSVARSGADISVYSPIKAKFQYLGELRKTFEDGMITLVPSSADQRLRLIDTGKTFYQNARMIFNEIERSQLDNLLSSLQVRDAGLRNIERNVMSWDYSQKRMLEGRYEEFKANLHRFDLAIGEALYRHNADGLSTKKKDELVNRLYLTVKTKPVFFNKSGIPISPEMEMFCRALYCRAKNGYDNILPIKGPRGVGKTSFSIALGTTYTEMTGLGFDWNRNMVINEDKSYVEALLASLQPLDFLQMDEAGNQLNRKLWYQADQIGFINYLTRLRVHGLTIPVIWPDSEDLDQTISKKYAIASVEINERGNAVVKAFNQNTHAKRDYIPNAAKNKVALTGEEADDITTQFDLLKIMEIPYYKIPDKIWNKNYEPRKELSLKVSSIKGVKKEAGLANQFYIKFFLNLPLDKTMITTLDVEKFGMAEGYQLSIRRCAIIIGKATGRGSNQILKVASDAPMIDADKYGVIEMDAYTWKYIENLRAMQKGAKERDEFDESQKPEAA